MLQWQCTVLTWVKVSQGVPLQLKCCGNLHLSVHIWNTVTALLGVSDFVNRILVAASVVLTFTFSVHIYCSVVFLIIYESPVAAHVMMQLSPSMNIACKVH